MGPKRKTARWCTQILPDGQPCQYWAIRGSSFCARHQLMDDQSVQRRRTERRFSLESQYKIKEWLDEMRHQQLPGVIKYLKEDWKDTISRTKSGRTIRQDAITDLAEILEEIVQLGPENIPEALAREYGKAMQHIISLGLDKDDPILGPFAQDWITSRRGSGDKEALRWAGQGLEKGVKRPHTDEEMRSATVISAAIDRQRLEGSERVNWTRIKREVESALGRSFGTLENFNKWVVRNLSDLLEELPPRKK